MSSVGWKKEERVFGGEAENAATRFPNTYFPYVKGLLGVSADQLPGNVSGIYPVTPRRSQRDTLEFTHVGAPESAQSFGSSKGETSWSVEEILAQQLDYVKSIASQAASEPVRDLFLTVPSYFSQSQRRALKDAADIAGLHLVGMISEGSAVGINFAMTRQFPEKEIHMVYDSGAMKTTVTVLEFETRPVPIPIPASTKSKKVSSTAKVQTVNTTFIRVLGSASAPWLGGVNIDETLRNILLTDLENSPIGKKLGVNAIRSDARAMRKLWKEAQRVKHILSANHEATVRVESLINDMDYRSSVSRVQLEEACSSFSGKFSQPIEDAKSAAGITTDQLESIIIFGGNTRVPMVQRAIKSSVPSEKIAQNVNADEAAVLGAAFYGASIGRQFQSKVKINLTEGIAYDIGFSEDGSSKYETILPTGSPIGTRHTLSFPAKNDLTVNFAYTGVRAPSPKELSSVQVHSDIVENVLKNLTDAEVAAAQIKLTVRIDSRGFFQTANAILSTTPKEGSMTGKLFGLFGSGSKDKEKNGKDGEEQAEVKEAGGEDEDAEALKESETPKEKRIPIKFTETTLGIKPLNAESKQLAKQRLSSIDAVERSVLGRAEARNLLEGYLYRLQNLLSEEASSKAIHDFATETEKKLMSAALSTAFDWLNLEGDRADEVTLKKQRADVEAHETPVLRRYTEFMNRPKAIDDFQKAMTVGRAFFVGSSLDLANATAEGRQSRFTQEELDPIFKMLKENEQYMEERADKQTEANKVYSNEPILLVSELEKRGRMLQNAVSQQILSAYSRKLE